MSWRLESFPLVVGTFHSAFIFGKEAGAACGGYWKAPSRSGISFYNTGQNVLIRWKRFIFITDSNNKVVNKYSIWFNIYLLWVLDKIVVSTLLFDSFFSPSSYPFCQAINWMWPFQPLVPNIHLPTHEDAQEDFGAPLLCLLHSLWSQWEENFYSKFKIWTLVWFDFCLESLSSLLVTDWDADMTLFSCFSTKFTLLDL